MTDLDKLIGAVEAGLPSPTSWRNFSAVPTGDEDNPGPILAHRAYYGDLNAAKALHDALLPGWGFELCEFSADVTNRNVDDGIAGYKFFTGRSDDPARAWLLAALKAFRATQEALK